MEQLIQKKSFIVNNLKLSKCERCGLCCIAGVCYAGSEDEFGICIHLKVHEDLTTSCDIAHLLDFIGVGCFLRGNTDIFNGLMELSELYSLDEIKRMTYERRNADD